MKKLIVAFHNFVNASKNDLLLFPGSIFLNLTVIFVPHVNKFLLIKHYALC